MRQSRVGLKDDWDHQVTILSPKAGDTDHKVTPDSGSVKISYIDATGTKKWFDGADFVATDTTLATTINGTRSQYPYTHKAETKGRVVTFEGWITRNGYDVEHVTYEVMVLTSGGAQLDFSA